MKRLAITIAAFIFLGGSAIAQRESVLVADNTPAAANGASTKYWIEGNEVRTEHAVVFAPGRADILPQSAPALQAIKKYLGEKSSITMLRIEGHVGCGEGAQALSEARARAVSKWLVAQGVDCKRVLPVGFGCSKPIVDDLSDLNARITFVNAALRGKPVGGMPVDGGGKAAANPCK